MDDAARICDVRFSNRPFGVKRFQTIHHYSFDVAHGLVLLCSPETRHSQNVYECRAQIAAAAY